MEFAVFLIFVSIFSFMCPTVDADKDIRKYFDKPYCEEATVGATKVKKCYTVVEVKEDKK